MFSLLRQSKKAILISAAIVATAAFTGRMIAAEREPSMVATAETSIQNTQKEIPQVDQQIASLQKQLASKQALRDQLTTSNAVNVGILRANCYEFDWQKSRAVKSENCQSF